LEAKYCWTIVDAFVSDATWMPDAGNFLKSGLGNGDDQAAAGYSAGAGLVYFPTSRAVVVDSTKIKNGRKVRLRWYDPTSGNYTEIAASEAKRSERSVDYPTKRHADGYNDWVLVVEGISE
jgi:hypothetical protein